MRYFLTKIVQFGEKTAKMRSRDDSWQAICQEPMEFQSSKRIQVAEGTAQ